MLTNCVLKHPIKKKTGAGKEVTRGQERRRKQLLDELKETRGYTKLKEEALHRSIWRNHFGIGYGHVERQTTE